MFFLLPQFAAELRLPERLSSEEKKKIVDELIDSLDIRKCAKTSEYPPLPSPPLPPPLLPTATTNSTPRVAKPPPAAAAATACS